MAVCPNGHDSASEDFCDVCGMRILSPGAASSPSAGTAPGAPVGVPVGGDVPQAAGPGQSCPVCGTARSGQFCESCGFNFATAQAPFPPGPSAPPVLPTPPDPYAAPSAPSPPPVPPAPPVPPLTPVPTERSVPVSPPSAPAPSAPPYAPVVWTAVVSSDRDYYDSVRAESGPEGESIPFPAYCAERRFPLSGSQMRIGRRSVSRGLDPEIDLTGPPADPGISRLHAVLIAEPDGSWSVLDPGSSNGTLVNGTEIPTGDHVRLRDGDRINLGAWTAITVRCG
jgi:hypothetical protein